MTWCPWSLRSSTVMASINKIKSPSTPPIDIRITQLQSSVELGLRTPTTPSTSPFDCIDTPIYKQKSRYLNGEHKLDTIDDYTLLELIKDMKEIHDKGTNHGDFKKALFKHFEINDQTIYKSLQQRISDLIIEMNKLLGIDNDDIETKDNNKLSTLDKPYKLEVDASFIELQLTPTPSQSGDASYKYLQQQFEEEIAPICLSSSDMIEQCLDSSCQEKMRQSQNIYDCPCIHRICILLKIYKRFQKIKDKSHTELVWSLYVISDECFIMI